jgi:hypothetical protein
MYWFVVSLSAATFATVASFISHDALRRYGLRTEYFREISASAPVYAPDVEKPVTPAVEFGSVTPAVVCVVMPVGLLEPSPTT